MWAHSATKQNFRQLKTISVIGSNDDVRYAQCQRLETKFRTECVPELDHDWHSAPTFERGQDVMVSYICNGPMVKASVLQNFPNDFVQLAMLKSGIGSVPLVIFALDMTVQSVIESFTTADRMAAVAQQYHFDCIDIPIVSPWKLQQIVKEVDTTGLGEDELHAKILELGGDLLNDFNK